MKGDMDCGMRCGVLSKDEEAEEPGLEVRGEVMGFGAAREEEEEPMSVPIKWRRPVVHPPTDDTPRVAVAK